MNDIITLIATGSSQNENGYPVDNNIVGREIFAEKKSATRTEFYTALSVGVTVSTVFKVATLDYNGETKVCHDGKFYKVERAYSPETSDYTELSCSDLKVKQNGKV